MNRNVKYEVDRERLDAYIDGLPIERKLQLIGEMPELRVQMDSSDFEARLAAALRVLSLMDIVKPQRDWH